VIVDLEPPAVPGQGPMLSRPEGSSRTAPQTQENAIGPYLERVFRPRGDLRVPPIGVLIADAHLSVTAGIGGWIASEGDLTLVGAASNLHDTRKAVEQAKPDVALVAFDLWPPPERQISLDLLRALVAMTNVILMYDEIDRHEAWRTLSAGAAGLLTQRASAEKFIDAIRDVARGGTSLDDEIQSDLAELSRHDPVSGPRELSKREHAVLTLSAEGFTTAQIAARVGLSASSVKASLHQIYAKLEVHDRAAAIAQGLRQGLIT
jgi:DNA-binding NarL/FixJ family response regulator